MFDDILSYSYLFFFYIIPWLLLLLVIGWFKDWILKIYKRQKVKAEKFLDQAKEERWIQILALMKILMFLVLLIPLAEIISYLFDSDAEDIGTELFTETMFLVFIVITAWYLLAMVITAIYIRNRRDMEDENEVDQ
jgi:uncharacterized membrane protein